MTNPDIHFMRITATTMNQICDLSETLSPAHRKMVADNVRSIAEAHFSPSAWMRAIYAGDTPIGFIMTHTGSDYEDGIDCPGVFLWRFMIAESYQGKGYGKRALEKLIQHLKAMGTSSTLHQLRTRRRQPRRFLPQDGLCAHRRSLRPRNRGCP